MDLAATESGANADRIATNEEQLVSVSLMGTIVHPGFPGLPAEPYRLASDGRPFLLPTYGGIVYNVSVGDPAFGWQADCVHPGISISHGSDLGNRGLNTFACVGNEATVITGRGERIKGVVTGKSGRFSEQVIVHVPKAARDRLAFGDKVVVKGVGVGMSLPDLPAIRLKSLSPRLFHALSPRLSGGRLEVPVVATVPPHLVGAGAGLTSEGGSLHIQTTDREAVAAAGLDRLRLGDIVAVADTDSRYQHGYLRGAMGIAVIGQTDGPRAGYGPGMTLLMTATDGAIAPVAREGVNLVSLLEIAD